MPEQVANVPTSDGPPPPVLPPLTPAQRARARILNSPALHFATCAKILDKRRNLVRPRPNILQIRMDQVYEVCQALKIPCKMIVLKPRQTGCSTKAAHTCYHHMRRYNAWGVEMADDLGNSNNLFMMFKRYAQTDEFNWGFNFTVTKKDIHFFNGENGLAGSFMEQDTANNPKAGISATRQVLHLSEVAKYADGGERDAYATISNMLASFNSTGPNSLAIAETTAEGACYDDQTDILTSEGWKRFADLTGDEQILTKDQQTGVAYYQPKWSKVEFPWSGPMVQIDTRTVNLLVTPNHSMWCSRQKGRMKMQPAATMIGGATDFYFERGMEWTAEGLTEVTIPAYPHVQGAGMRTIPEKSIPIDVWLTYLGHWLADGHVTFKPGNKCAVLTQSKFIDEFRASAQAMADAMGAKLRETAHGTNARRFIIESCQLAKYLFDFSQPKRIPRELLMGLSKAQCRKFIDAIYEGDGDVEARSRPTSTLDHGKIYAGIDKTFQDDLQELALKAGYATSAYGPDRNRVATFTESTRACVRHDNPPTEVHGYNGTVHCVSLPKDHLLMVRRGGTAVWCGNSGWFYEHWMGKDDQPGAAWLEDFLDGRSGNGWIKVFAAWHEFIEHALDRANPQDAEYFNDADMRFVRFARREAAGRKKYGWTDEQVAWRRYTVISDCGGDERIFDMHYPEDPETCFLASGTPRFDQGGMAALDMLARLEKVRYGQLNAPEGDPHSISFTELDINESWFQMHEEPRAGYRYLCVVDNSEGSENQSGDDPDRHSAAVWRMACRDEQGRELPMRIAGRVIPPCYLDTDMLAAQVVKMSRYYGRCCTVVERNKGALLIKLLKDEGVDLYVQQRVDKVTSKMETYYGYLTDAKGRHDAIERLAPMIRDTTVDNPKLIVDAHTVKEFRTFVKNAKGRYEARAGCHDDDVMQTAIASCCVENATLYREKIRRRRQPADLYRWRRVGGKRR